MTTTPGVGWAPAAASAVRERLGPGRLLPLGEAADGAWLAERAARAVLLRAAGAVRGVVPGALRVGLATAGRKAPWPVPPGGLPPGTLRITGEFAAEAARVADRPLPELAEAVRGALFASAERELGLAVVAVDLRVTGLAEAAPDSPATTPPPGRTAARVTARPTTDDPVARAVLGVPGVAGLTSVLGRPVHRTPGALRVELAVFPGHRALDVARAARTRAAEAAPAATAVTVLVAEIR
ncbi:hypothetical protein Q5762_25685 [Streptomyces sp. P9(2023)]|uniref:hypothetical protein n=1 Tax=Streptomyces sp. P9(2023) TaxID=3064394 RepID=UPI0028F4438E|nr:hypothetical protein [Streptomyces sp. P9(2023)]MDT9691674.1 hypothetical protein [Streptomyces sp. P9(2023)]